MKSNQKYERLREVSNKIYINVNFKKNRTKAVVDLSIEIGNSCPVLKIVKISCENGIKIKPKVINVIAHLESRLSTSSHYAVDET